MTDPTLTRLRIRLTALYFAAMAGLLILLGGIAYASMNLYFQSATDQALHFKMAREQLALGLTLSPDLQQANLEYERQRGSAPGGKQVRPAGEFGDEVENHSQVAPSGAGGTRSLSAITEPGAFDGDLSAIFVVPLDAQGQKLISDTNLTPPAFTPDQAAVKAALATGSDLRTIDMSNGVQVRLYTYRLPVNQTVTFLQLGRVLTDQQLVLQQLLTGLLVVGAVLVILATLCSWWLAGRSLLPAQQAWERQRLFVANASHELRTPLSIIQLSAELAARDDATDTERRELAGDVLREAQYMTRLVADLLLLSRLDVGQMKLDLQPVAVPELLGEVQRDVIRLGEEQGVKIELLDTQGTVTADRLRLRQALLVVLDNALRHTPQGGHVTLESHVHGRAITVDVKDTGSGIAPEHLPRLFDRFYQVDSAHSKKGSAGLGLSIAKSLIEAMRGHIDIASEVGKGTQVTITLPAGGERTSPAGQPAR